MSNAHNKNDLKQLQSLPLEAKIRLTKERIKVWYESWTRFEIYNKKTKKTRFVTMDTRDTFAEPKMKKDECIVSVFPGQVYLGFSGGKDSTVLKHIIDSMYPDVPSVFANTGLEYPEIQKFVKEIKAGKYDCFNSDVEIIRPEMRFDEVIKKYGYPVISKSVSNTVRGARKSIKEKVYSYRLCLLGVKKEEYGGLYDDGTYDYEKKQENSKFKQTKYRYLIDAPFNSSEQCCNIMKKRPMAKYQKETGRKAILATMASESMNREAAWYKNGCNAFNSKHPKSTPMSFWTDQDILHYIKKYVVPYCPVYGDIQVKKGKEEFEGQVNIIDFLGCYEPEDELETTGCDGTGCIFCMFGCHLEKGKNRFQRLKETHPPQYEFCINGGEMVDGEWKPNKKGLGLWKVLDYIGVKYD